MKLTRIAYKEGHLWVDKEADCPKGTLCIFPNTRNSEILNFDGCEPTVVKQDFAQNGVWNLKIVAQTNLELPNVPYIEIGEEDIEALAIKQVEIEGWGKYEGTSEQFGVKNSFKAGYKAAKEKYIYTEKDILYFSWWLFDNVGRYSDDKQAHFNEEYLKMWAKDKNKLPNEIEIEMIEGCKLLKIDAITTQASGNGKFTPVTYFKNGKTYLSINKQTLSVF